MIQTPGLPYQQRRLQRLARDNQSSLLQKSINYVRKIFYRIGPRPSGQKEKKVLSH
jgi:hypothetical protein